MKKLLLIGGGILALGAIVFLVIWLLTGDSLEKAIDRYESGRYEASLVMLGRLAPKADYETGERIHYYRCRAINGLAEKLEKKYDDELRAASLENESAAVRDREKRYLESRLAKINAKTGGDLALVMGRKRSRIVSRGGFYDEFLARYKGSRYIEELDFEELKKIARTERSKLLGAIANYYERYPGTFYLSSIVKMIMGGLQDGDIAVKGREDLLKQLIVEYGSRYPTSADVHRFYQCTGEDVNLRNAAGVEGQIVGKVKRGEILVQLEKSMDTAQVGEVRDYWYRVAGLSGLRGWIFGKFLEPLEMKAPEGEARARAWSIEDHFAEWDDSNTPKNWIHVPGADRSAISFALRGDSRIVKLSSPRGRTAGLFRRFDAGASFALCARARFVAGDAVTLFAHRMKNGRLYYLRLRDEEIELSERRIPLHTSDSHEYILESKDGQSARLLVDGEVVLSKLPPVEGRELAERGIYCLFSDEKRSSLCELEYIKIKN